MSDHDRQFITTELFDGAADPITGLPAGHPGPVTIGVDIGTGEDYGAVVLSTVQDGQIHIIGSASGRGPAFWLTVRAFLDAVRRRVKNVRIFGDE